MAYTQDDVDTLRRNIGKGVKKLRLSNGEEVEFDSYDAMKRRLIDMEAEIAGRSATGFGSVYPKTTRGL